MLGNLDILPNSYPGASKILHRNSVKTCHIVLPDTPKPIGAIAYDNKLYSFVKAYPIQAVAERAVDRLIQHGNQVVLTETPKGLVLWVFEPDAKRIR